MKLTYSYIKNTLKTFLKINLKKENPSNLISLFNFNTGNHTRCY